MYCHSNASRIEAESNVKDNTSLAWTDTYAAHPELDRCAQCHGNQPTTGAHAAHSVGVHTFNEVTLENGGVGIVLDGNIFNGVSGKVPITNKPNTAHGNPNNSTTISCYICHNVTVTSKANDKNYKCSPCHVGGAYNASPKGLAAISNLKNHVNGLREVEFEPVHVLSKAQIRPKGPNKTNSTFDFYSGVWTRTSYKNMSTLSFDRAKVALNTATMWHYSSARASNCSNISCHNNNFVKWNLDNYHDPNKCMDCHNAL
jgi:predicted CxxxxCH...CXXCH cytochrome family protein